MDRRRLRGPRNKTQHQQLAQANWCIRHARQVRRGSFRRAHLFVWKSLKEQYESDRPHGMGI